MQWGYELQKTGRNLGPKWDLSQPYKACHGANQQTQCHKPFGLLKNVISHIHVSVLWSTALVAMSHVFFAKKKHYHPSAVLQHCSNWLVVSTYPSEKYIRSSVVSWDDYSIPNCFWKVIEFHGSKPPTSDY